MSLIRAMQQDDLPAIMAIEELCFPDPWPMEAFAFTQSCLNYVAEQDGSVIAYLMCIVALDECMIANFATHPHHQRQGHASSLLGHLLHQCPAMGIKSVYLDVRKSNDTAQALYQKHGFDYLGIRKNYYNNPPEDAMVMVWHQE